MKITFRFPVNEQLRDKWIKACRRANWMPSKTSVLCSEHFDESQIDRSSLLSVRLLKNVVNLGKNISQEHCTRWWVLFKA